jgi:hypothetical protein
MVYISNIPYEMRWMEIKDLVREKAGEVTAFTSGPRGVLVDVGALYRIFLVSPQSVVDETGSRVLPS